MTEKQTAKNEPEAVAIARNLLVWEAQQLAIAADGTRTDLDVRVYSAGEQRRFARDRLHAKAEALTLARCIVEQHDAREAARASMPSRRTVLVSREGVASRPILDSRENPPDALERARTIVDEGSPLTPRSFAEPVALALIAAHEREVELRAELRASDERFQAAADSVMACNATIAELRAVLVEVCDLAGYGLQSTTDARRLDAWRKLAEGGK